MPLFSKISIPLPLTSGLGSFEPIKTSSIPLSINKSVQGGVFEYMQQGSNVINADAPKGSVLQLSIAFFSA